jgi:hypothetical protein
MRSSPVRSIATPEVGGAPLGPCPICGRPMIEGPSVDRHHFVPRSEGGREAVPVHRVCHRKLHSLWTERELALLFSTPEAVHAHPEMQRFIRWLQRKPPEFWVRTEEARSKGRRRA